MTTKTDSARAQIFDTDEAAEEALLSREVRYALYGRRYPSAAKVYYTYIFCTVKDAKKLLPIKLKDGGEWCFVEKSDFVKNHPGFMLVSVPYTEAKEVLSVITC
jgi:hypothetical protein